MARCISKGEECKINRRVARLAGELLAELESSSLEVVLVPDRRADSYGNDFRKLRAVQTQNAAWYQKFCAQHLSNRRGAERWGEVKTKVKRQDTRRGLAELQAGRCQSEYAKMLRAFIVYEYC